MSGSIGSSTSQVQPNIIQNSVQQNAQKSIQRQTEQPKQEIAQAAQNQNFQKLAESIIAQRASGEVTQQAPQRGQVVNLLV